MSYRSNANSYKRDQATKIVNYTKPKRNVSYIYLTVKRAADIVLSIIGLVMALPLILIAGACVKLESRGPVFYRQERLGMDGIEFTVTKIRSMRIDAEKNGAQWATENDPRITKIGTFIRKTRIDELPQLLNVLKGEMSLVGPRPERPIFAEKFAKEIPGFEQRLEVKPGLTGWAQVNGGYDITPSEKLQLDRYYIHNSSIGLDLQILFRTVKVVLTGSGAR
ncbi:sugar transferase [Paenibacillus sp. CAU 1782]